MAKASIFDILTVQWVKDVFLQGIDLTDENGVAFPEELYRSALRSAVDSLEQLLDIVIDPIEVKGERHDMTDRGRQACWPFYLKRRPLNAINAAKMKFGNQYILIMPTVWITSMNDEQSYVHLIPQEEGTATAQQVIIAPSTFMRYDYMPGWYSFDYTAGFRVYTGTTTFAIAEQSKAVTFSAGEQFKDSGYFCTFSLVGPNAADADIVPYPTDKLDAGMTVKLSRGPANALTVRWYITDCASNMRQLIGMRAARPALVAAGNLVLGAGVMSRTTGLDGLSQSTQTTKSAIGGAYAGIIKDHEAQEENILQGLRRKYRSVNFGAI